MRTFLQFTIFGLATGGIYAVSASGLVLTYTTSGVFNFAHGAMGMLMAFLFWELRVNQGWPTWLAVVVVVFVVAPLMGAVIERTLIRNLEGAPLVTSLVVTIGLMLGLMALAAIIWPTKARRLPFFFGSDSFPIVGVNVTYHRALALVLAVVIAVALGAFLRFTRSGLAMRAVVDSRPLSALNGSRPGRSSMISWAIGASLAAVSGILLAPLLSLTIEPLTLLVVYSYAAAVFGRLTSLPLTFVGAMIIGLAQSYAVGYLPTGEWVWLGTISNAIPVVALFIFLLIVPPAHLRGATLVKRAHLRVPSFTRSLTWGLVMLAVAYVIIGLYDGVDLRRIGQGLAFSIIALSLVPLTGYAGQISLCQMTFAGLGAWAMAEWGAGGSALGLIAAIVIAGAGGFLVALPTLRLQGLYLALATMSFAAFMDAMFFRQRWALSGGGIAVSRLELGPVSFASQRAYFMLLALTFVLLGMFILWIRRGAFGRRLIALRDSPAALETLGLSVARTRLAVFTLSAGMAGLGGALLGGLRRTVGPDDFQMFMSLPILVLAVVGGVTTVVGPLFGGMFLSILPWLGESRAALGKLAALAPGLVGIGLGRNPDGVVAEFAHQRDRARGDDPDSVREARLDEVCAPGTPPGARIDPERIPMLDQVLELDVAGAVSAMESDPTAAPGALSARRSAGDRVPGRSS